MPPSANSMEKDAYRLRKQNLKTKNQILQIHK